MLNTERCLYTTMFSNKEPVMQNVVSLNESKEHKTAETLLSILLYWLCDLSFQGFIHKKDSWDTFFFPPLFYFNAIFTEYGSQ